MESGKTLCTIYDLSYLEMTLNIDELDISTVEAGQTVQITAEAVEGKTFTGVVTKVSVAGTTSGLYKKTDPVCKLKKEMSRIRKFFLRQKVWLIKSVRTSISCIRGRNQTASTGGGFSEGGACLCGSGTSLGVYRKRAGHGTAEPSKI